MGTRFYKCLEMDFEINPADERFRWSNGQDNELICSDPRNSAQQVAHCECEAQFATTLGALWDDNTYDYSMWNRKNNNQFTLDKEAVCVGNGGQTDECCGDYPTRFPYSTVLQCCSDGNARVSC